MLDLFHFLQWFGEGGGDGAGAAPGGPADGQATESTGVTVPDAGERNRPQRKGKGPSRLPYEYGKPAEPETSAAQSQQAQEPAPQPEQAEMTQEEWDSLIKGRGKDFFGKAVKGIMDKRFRNQHDQEAELTRTRALLARAAERYDMQPNESGAVDLDAFEKALDDDDSLYEKLADKMGTSIDYAKKFDKQDRQIKAMEQEAAKRLKDAEDLALYQRHVAQAEALKKDFPDFDLLQEMDNRTFATLLRNNVSVEDAFYTVHHREIMEAQRQNAAQQAAKAVSNKIQAGAARPSEGGLGRQPAANNNRILDPKQMTREMFKDIRQRSARGEKFYF